MSRCWLLITVAVFAMMVLFGNGFGFAAFLKSVDAESGHQDNNKEHFPK